MKKVWRIWADYQVHQPPNCLAQDQATMQVSVQWHPHIHFSNLAKDQSGPYSLCFIEMSVISLFQPPRREWRMIMIWRGWLPGLHKLQCITNAPSSFYFTFTFTFSSTSCKELQELFERKKKMKKVKKSGLTFVYPIKTNYFVMCWCLRWRITLLETGVISSNLWLKDIKLLIFN